MVDAVSVIRGFRGTGEAALWFLKIIPKSGRRSRSTGVVQGTEKGKPIPAFLVELPIDLQVHSVFVAVLLGLLNRK